ncbi:MAG: peptidylprolyl isomerase [Vicinamibacterales bacterium]
MTPTLAVPARAFLGTCATAAILALLAGLAVGPSVGAQPGSAADVTVRLETDAGPIDIVLQPSKAPKTVANFLRYVDGRYYDGGVFHRAVRLDNQVRKDVRIEVVQATIAPGKRPFPAIPLERTSISGLRHVDGTVSMGRIAEDSGRTDFFVCIGDQPSLDFGGARHGDGQGFAAFGRVVNGMDVVRRIQALETDEQEHIKVPVVIRRARRLR